MLTTTKDHKPTHKDNDRDLAMVGQATLHPRRFFPLCATLCSSEKID